MSILLSKETTFIVQGITGREAVNLTRECLDYGSKVVGGVTPGRKGREVHGVPVFDTVAQAVENHGAPIDGSVVTVPPAFTKDAVLEAIENGIELIVIVTERIPRRDVAQMVELANLRGARIIGPNCLGLIVPEVCKMGGIGGPAKDAAKAYAPGPVGVMSRSGGMTTEISSSLTQAGLGVSTAVSIGGDAIIGSTYAELMPYFEADEQTQAIVIYTEPGGRMEAQLSAWVKENDSRLPIVAFMAGKFMDDEEMKGMSFGHAGTIVEGVEDTATEKIARLEAAGNPRRRADRRNPRRGQAEAGGDRLMAEALSKVFIDVEVDASVAGDAELAKKLEEVCPVDIFKATDSGVELVEEQPRRVRPLQPLRRRRARGRGARDQAVRAVATGPLLTAASASSRSCSGMTTIERSCVEQLAVPVDLDARLARLAGDQGGDDADRGTDQADVGVRGDTARGVDPAVGDAQLVGLAAAAQA